MHCIVVQGGSAARSYLTSEFHGNNFNKKREPEVPEKHLLPEAILNIIPDCHEKGKFSSSSGGDMCHRWKA